MPTIDIKGMSCKHCTDSVTKALSAIDGISNVIVNLEKSEAQYEENKPIAKDVIVTAIKQIGFEVI